MRVTNAGERTDDAPWPHGFPKKATATCATCGAVVAFDSPRDFTVKHQPLAKGEERHIPLLPDGRHVDGDVPLDPHGKAWVIAYECPGCGVEQIVEV